MATAERFEDLQVWQKARSVVGEVFADIEAEPMSRRYRFCDQYLAAAVSIMNNIAEGFERGGRKDFLQFLHIAKGSAGELRSMLYAALDGKLISTPCFETRRDSLSEISRMIAGLIKYLQTTPHRGPQFKNFQER